ncbi:MAG: alpha/beta fold hydrolase [Vulcanococcus sp.]
MPVSSFHWLQRLSLALLAAAAGPLWTAPAGAIEEVLIELPLLSSSFSVKVSELKSPRALMAGRSDLAELDRASDGAVSQLLMQVLQRPIPISMIRLADGSVGSPLLEQAFLVVSSLGTIEGRDPDLTGQTFRQALDRARANANGGEPTLVELIEALPGQRVRFNLGQVKAILGRMLAQRFQANSFFAQTPPDLLPTAPAPSSSPAVRQRQVRLAVPHRTRPLEVVLVEPSQGGNGRLVLISHGLWDSPKNFASWGALLASRGYTVALPRHPGSDNKEQALMLKGAVPPPKPIELALRFRDLSAVTDAVAAGQLIGVTGVNANAVVVIGHSWGATTALQQAGLVPQATTLKKRCPQTSDPQRNLSWTLQCSWLDGVDQAALRDPRVVAAVAVSPPMSLLFSVPQLRNASARLLVVSGTHDWVVPPDPEAITPMRQAVPFGHQLVLAKGGDHFNLRPGQQANGGVLGPLLLAWVEAAYQAGPALSPSAGAPPLLGTGPWGHPLIPLKDVSAAIQSDS